MAQDLDRIAADFASLGAHGPGHENEIDLGTADAANLAGHTLNPGAPAIFYEEGGLEAPGVLVPVREGDHFYWIARIDLAAIRDLDEAAPGDVDATHEDGTTHTDGE